MNLFDKFQNLQVKLSKWKFLSSITILLQILYSNSKVKIPIFEYYLVWCEKFVNRNLSKCPDNLKVFFRWNPSGTFRNILWHHWNIPKKVPGAPSQGFLNFLVFVKNITKSKNWLSRPHFWADFQVSYHFGKVLTVRSQGFTASKNLSLHQWDMSISKIKNWML